MKVTLFQSPNHLGDCLPYPSHQAHLLVAPRLIDGQVEVGRDTSFLLDLPLPVGVENLNLLNTTSFEARAGAGSSGDHLLPLGTMSECPCHPLLADAFPLLSLFS